MDFDTIRYILGTLSIVLGVAMTPALGWSLYYGENDVNAFMYSIAIAIVIGLLLRIKAIVKKDLGLREGFLTVTLGWLFAALFGALPFVFHGSAHTFIDGFFEAMSGFTTAGATIMANVETLPHGILFWRSFTNWLGGMGIIVLFLAILPGVGAGGFHMFRAEVPGPSVSKLSFRLAHTAKTLWHIYFGFTVLQTVLLMAVGLNLFNSLTHAFGTVATGGFSTKNLSIGAFKNPEAEIIILIFMMLSGINFSLYYYILKKQWDKVFYDEELRFYLGTIFVTTLIIIWNIRSLITSKGDLLRTGIFQVVSITTTTAYSVANIDLWPAFSKMLLLILMFFGGCAGSTGGGMKQIRVLILLKYCKRELVRLLHPKAIIPIKTGGRAIPEDVLRNIMAFSLMYLGLFALGSLSIAMLGQDMMTSVSSVAAALNNIGPGLGSVGPYSTYSQMPQTGKLILSFLMLMGRLEIFTVFLCFTPGFWRNAVI